MNYKKSFFSLFLLLMMTFSFGEVVFNINFKDPEGVGFNAPENKEKKEKVREGAELLGKIIKQNANVSMEVRSEESIITAGSVPITDPVSMIFRGLSLITGSQLSFFQIHRLLQGNQPIVMESMNKIINKKSSWRWYMDIGVMRFNVNNLSLERIKLITIHEMTHILGFASLFKSALYGKYDQLIHDGSDNPLIIEYDGWFGKGLEINSEFDFSADLYLCGANIRKRNKGECLKLYNNEYSQESSYDHLDFKTYPRNIMSPYLVDSYPIWNSYEIGIMEDLGYEIDWGNYCKLINRENFPVTTLIVDAEEVEDVDFSIFRASFKCFPEECFESCTNIEEKYEGSFSTVVIKGDELRLVYGDRAICTWDITGEIEAAKEALKESRSRKSHYSSVSCRNPMNDKHFFMEVILEDAIHLEFKISSGELSFLEK